MVEETQTRNPKIFMMYWLLAVGTPALSGGVATYSTAVLTAGRHTVSAMYGTRQITTGARGRRYPTRS